MMLESIVRAAGYQTGLYTSPNLHYDGDGIRWNGKTLPNNAWPMLMDAMEEAIAQMGAEAATLTRYEVMTACALLWFAWQHVTIAILEIGLGGRDDAVNVVDGHLALLSVIDRDHTHILGNTPAAIARIKAGIIRPNRPVITVPQHPSVLDVLREECVRHRAPLSIVHVDGLCEDASGVLRPFLVAPALDMIGVRGTFQIQNARLAVGASMMIGEEYREITSAAVRQGLGDVACPARLEVLHLQPRIVVDGAHNPHAAAHLAESLPLLGTYRHLILVFGTSHDKDIDGIAQILFPLAALLILTKSRHGRAMPIDDLMTRTCPYHTTPPLLTDNSNVALDQAMQHAHPDDLILVTGSLFLAAEACAWSLRAKKS